MDKIDYTKCYDYIACLNGMCSIIWIPCNPNHPDCEYEDESKLGIPDDLWEEK